MKSIKFKLILTVSLIFVGLSACLPPEWIKTSQPDVEVFPASGSTLSGYQILSVLFNQNHNLEIKDIKVTSNGRIFSILSDTSFVNKEASSFEAEICAECLESNDALVTISFEGDYLPITLNYKINHLPKVHVALTQDSTNPTGMPVLDASASFDPDDNPLQFTWHMNGNQYMGPVISVDPFMLREVPLLLEVNDGNESVFDVISIDPFTNELVYTPDRLKCIDMTIATAGRGELNGETTLGAFPAVGTQLAVDADEKLTRSYVVGFAFEVRADIRPDRHVLDEGQDAAGSVSFEANDATKTNHRNGKVRREADRSTYEADETQAAPFPNPIPRPGTHPKMTEDKYDHHPSWGFSDRNDGGRMTRMRIKAKGLVGANKMVWYDQPGLRLNRGADMSKGMFFRGYFRSWMSPDLDECQKYFIVDIEIDDDGKVTKNELRMR